MAPSSGTTAATTPAVPSSAVAESSAPAYASLVVSPQGIGSLQVGAAPALSSMIRFSANHCDADPLYASSGGYPGAVSDRWLSTYPDFGGSGFMVAAADVVSRIDVRDPALVTAEGAGVGTAEADLTQKYGDRLSMVYSGSVSDVWALADTPGTLVFEVAKDRSGGSYWDADKANRVSGVRVLAAGIDPAFATAGTDNQAGSCV
ncbi:hypothetical protein [Subtercola sp. RTI3]|uniref:hypothetical protein n=1 Tax=Subtercola sp. RTI3 TaxID=3048639 RepID=UPI002B239350|nr:hypothetical protein [Subtercola sp. RTI3]MEA9985322.1 hypothetical protein [Subtercola sp. RTI3]